MARSHYSPRPERRKVLPSTHEENMKRHAVAALEAAFLPAYLPAPTRLFTPPVRPPTRPGLMSTPPLSSRDRSMLYGASEGEAQEKV